MKLVPTILCGGAGSRLWPVSRELHPKPFIRLADGQSLLQKAFLRGARLPGASEVLTVTNRELIFKTSDEYREINERHLATSYILEPMGRNTAAAVAVAALHVAQAHGPEAIMLVLPADHLIGDEAAFATAVGTAIGLAEGGKIVTFGVQPDTPETGYGYIEAEGSRVVRFVEKPSLALAQEYLASGRFLWNSGMFCFSATTILAEMKLHSPDILSAAEACLEKSRSASGTRYTQLELDSPGFAAVPSLSIDYAVMEKSSHLVVVPCTIAWSDIGSWKALGDLNEADAEGNRVEGEDVILIGSQDCYVQSDRRVIAGVGLNNLIIIDTPDALLVADRDRAQDVKLVFEKLKADGHDAHKIHQTVHRPWGTYSVLEDGPRFKIKRIEVKPGASLSLQMHHHRSEHWVVVSGVARVVNGEEEMLINTNESTFIRVGHRHRLANPGVLPLVMIEVQCGDYLGEDDIVRFDDVYGRS